MKERDLTDSLASLGRELIHGAPGGGPAYMLNRGDAGLLASLDRLTAAQASVTPTDGGTIAGHVEHLRYGLSLLNRWTQGEDAFAGANWAQSWQTRAVSDDEWIALRAAFRAEAERWLAALESPRATDAASLNEIVGSLAHLAYHLGAIRQIDRNLRGPRAND